MSERPDFSALKSALSKRKHRRWCDLSYALVHPGKRERVCTCGLDSALKRLERLEGMAMDAGKDAN